ncbi:MAG: tRNA 2-thiouridine(34) synthase MnmA [Kiritimatiellae bacterium]|nr:tRNA 2-thiouridine(34) synthase MnmA [Kiritimatiellia bacterium]
MRVAVGLSGGVDSAVAALLLKRAGHEVVGITMKVWRDGRYKGGCRDACFGPGEAEDIAAADDFAQRIGIPYHVFDCADAYEAIVLDYFRREKREGRTPNPCSVCNPRMKFGFLPDLAARHFVFDRFATGHYARIRHVGNRLAVACAKDVSKDQSYFLWGLSQEQLARVMFPLGESLKAEVRRVASEAGLPMATKPDSQDFYSGDCAELLGTADLPGDIVTTSGEVLGTHRGYWHYTVGQRRGLDIGGGTPYYVLKIDKATNRIVVGRREEAICTEFRLRDLNWMGNEPTKGEVEGFVKIRSSGTPVGPVTLGNGIIRVSKGIFGVAPGQSAVIYSPSGAILCGGVIQE